MSIYNFASEAGQVSAIQVGSIDEGNPVAQASLLGVMAILRGRVDDPKVRVWTYTLDGHDFYVIRLGNIETLVYDTHSEQWSVFGDEGNDLWKAYQGINWLGSEQLAHLHGSNIVVGDDSNGSLYFLNPEQYTDDHRVDGADNPQTFQRIFQGQLNKRGYDYERCFAVELLGSIGQMDNPLLTDIALTYSDDRGNTYVDAGTVTVANGDLGARVDWRSLGSFTAPGRIFKITDTGGFFRIDSLTADTDKER